MTKPGKAPPQESKFELRTVGRLPQFSDLPSILSSPCGTSFASGVSFRYSSMVGPLTVEPSTLPDHSWALAKEEKAHVKATVAARMLALFNRESLIGGRSLRAATLSWQPARLGHCG